MTIPPIDTSTLGPVKVEPDVVATRARVVREALIAVANGEPDVRVEVGLPVIAEMMSDEGLSRLARMLKHTQ